MRFLKKIQWPAVSMAWASILHLASCSLTHSSLVESREPCPTPCNSSVADAFTYYNNIRQLVLCDQHMIFEFSNDQKENDKDDWASLRACTLYQQAESSQTLRARDTSPLSTTSLCVEEASLFNVSLDIAMVGDGGNFTYVTADALAEMSTYMSASCDLKQAFSYGLGAVVGVFSGAAVDNGGTVPSVLSEAIALVNSSDSGAPESMYIQRCTAEGISDHIFGVAINIGGDFEWVQSAMTSWSSGICLNSSSLPSANHSSIYNITIHEYSHPNSNLSVIAPNNRTVTDTIIIGSPTATSSVGTITSIPLTSGVSGPSSLSSLTRPTTTEGVAPPGPTQSGIISTCNKYAIPEKDQGCWDFAVAHGITPDQLYAWNPAVGECTAFLAGYAYCIGISGSAKRNDNLHAHLAELERRADCNTIKVVSGDSCGALADKCKITPDEFTKYNPDICSKLVPGQRVCCSAGTLPDITPKPFSNGSCYSYTVQKDENCATIGAEYGLTNDQIDQYNNLTTWGWFGCEKLPALLRICLSTGKPPLPNSVPNAQCGPIKPGTEMPTNGTDIALLNPCPLNACCNMFGQCGITPEYCTNHTGPAGNPGTAPEHENGCISNCGTEIKVSPVHSARSHFGF